MASRERPPDRAIREAGHGLVRIGADIRSARVAAGLSLRTASGAVGVSYSTFWRIERGLAANASVRAVALAGAAVGLATILRAYPAGDPVRDAGQLALLGRLRAELSPDTPWHTEVPIPIPGDLRAIDARTVLEGATIGFEAESRLMDVQALDRRAQLKKRDARLDRLILVVADTRSNRAVLAVHRDALRATFPPDTRAVLVALRAGKAPSRDGLIVI